DDGGSRSAYQRLDKVESKAGRVVIIPLQGAMSRNGDYCSWGTSHISSWLLEAYTDPNVAGVILETNSGGGAVDGTELLAETIRQRTKPVVGYVTGMAASAAYWAISQCDEIVMESAAASEVGSIGIIAMHVDMTQAYEKAGFKVTIIRSQGSEEKALFNSSEPLTEEIKATVQAEMAPIKDAFIKQVVTARPGMTKELTKGGMYNGKQAVKNGMADSIGYMGDAIARLVKLQSNY
ncbi:protease-4, partial [Dyadobacter jejuensis]